MDILELARMILDGWNVRIDARFSTHFAGFTTAILFGKKSAPTADEEGLKAQLALRWSAGGWC